MQYMLCIIFNKENIEKIIKLIITKSKRLARIKERITQMKEANPNSREVTIRYNGNLS